MLPNGNIPGLTRPVTRPSAPGVATPKNAICQNKPQKRADWAAKRRPAAPSEALSRCAPGCVTYVCSSRTKNHARVLKILRMTRCFKGNVIGSGAFPLRNSAQDDSFCDVIPAPKNTRG
jgi:hypothetical protein